MKNILLFFPDCPINENNGAGIYLKNVVGFLNKYYDVHIYCLVGRYALNKEFKTTIDNIRNITIIHPLDIKEFKKIKKIELNKEEKKTWYTKDNFQIYSPWKTYLVVKRSPIICASHWYTLLNKIINDFSINYTFIRDSRFLFYYNELCVYDKFKIKNVFFINIPPVINHTYYNIRTKKPMIYTNYKKYLEKNSLYESILITPCVDTLDLVNNIYIPPMIFNNDSSTNIDTTTLIKDTGNNVISFTGTLVDAQEIIQIIRAFDRALNDKVLSNNFILNITGKDVFSDNYSKLFKNALNSIKNKSNIIVNISKNGVDHDIIKDIIEESILCIRLDTTREVISTKVLNYIKAKKPIILQNLEVHKFLFGDDYPFYIDKNITKCEDSIYKLFAQINNENINKANKYIENAYNKSDDVFLYNSNFKLKKMLGVKKKEEISYPIKYESYTFKNLKWNRVKKKTTNNNKKKREDIQKTRNQISNMRNTLNFL